MPYLYVHKSRGRNEKVWQVPTNRVEIRKRSESGICLVVPSMFEKIQGQTIGGIGRH